MAGDILHFALNRSYYEAHKDLFPHRADSTPRFSVFHRGGIVWAANGLVFDESDEVMLPQVAQSQRAQRAILQSELGCGPYRVLPLGGHFYAADFSC